jgi:hypothetical protein
LPSSKSTRMEPVLLIDSRLRSCISTGMYLLMMVTVERGPPPSVGRSEKVNGLSSVFSRNSFMSTWILAMTSSRVSFSAVLSCRVTEEKSSSRMRASPISSQVLCFERECSVEKAGQ